MEYVDVDEVKYAATVIESTVDVGHCGTWAVKLTLSPTSKQKVLQQ